MTKVERMKVVRDALLSIKGLKVWHYLAPAKHGDEYVVWQDEDSRDLKADGLHVEDSLEGTIDLFTKTEYSARIAEIEQALATARIGYELNSTQYEDDTGFIHYEWTWAY